MAKRRFRSRGRFTRLRRTGGRFKGRRAARFIKRIVRRMCEIKYKTSSTLASVRDSLAGYFSNVTPLFVQGVNKDQRIGNTIKYKFFQFRATIEINGARLFDTVRAILFQPRNVVPAFPVAGLNFDFIFDQPNITSSIKNQNVRILMDKTRTMGMINNANPDASGTLFSNNNSNWLLKKKVRINNSVTFKNSVETLPSDPKDTYYFLIVSSRAVANQSEITTSWVSRISFIDM